MAEGAHIIPHHLLEIWAKMTILNSLRVSFQSPNFLWLRSFYSISVSQIPWVRMFWPQLLSVDSRLALEARESHSGSSRTLSTKYLQKTIRKLRAVIIHFSNFVPSDFQLGKPMIWTQRLPEMSELLDSGSETLMSSLYIVWLLGKNYSQVDTTNLNKIVFRDIFL